MQFGRNIMLSVAIHATLITFAAGYVSGRDAVLRVPDKIINISLIEGLTENAPHSVAVRWSKTAAGILYDSQKKDKAAMRPVQVEKPEQKVLPSPRDSGKNEARTDKPGLQVPVLADAGAGNKAPSPGFGYSLSGNPAAASSATSVAAKGGSHETGGIGRQSPDITGRIRAAVEKAKNYPLLAKKRGIEGTATTEFTINSNGLPENIRIVRSSGSDILDSAAKNTVVRASPFPAVSGIIEIPITFRLKRE